MKECLMTVRQATETALRNKGIKKTTAKIRQAKTGLLKDVRMVNTQKVNQKECFFKSGFQRFG